MLPYNISFFCELPLDTCSGSSPFSYDQAIHLDVVAWENHIFEMKRVHIRAGTSTKEGRTGLNRESVHWWGMTLHAGVYQITC